MIRLGLACVFTLLLLNPAFSQNAMTPEQQAEVALTAGRKAYADGNLPVAIERYREIITKFAGTKAAQPARYGLGLCLLNGEPQDLLKAIESFTPPSQDGGFPERAEALYKIAICQRALGLVELRKPATTEALVTAQAKAANDRFQLALNAFDTARDVFHGRKSVDESGRCRCDAAEMLIRLKRVSNARDMVRPFIEDPAFAKNAARPLGMYYFGFAHFLEKDYKTASRTLNQLAPFSDPSFGIHARYLVGRMLHMAGDDAEASVHYEAVLAGYAQAKAQAVEALKKPDDWKGKPFEKARLAALATEPPPDYVVGSAFFTASLKADASRFAEATTAFESFLKEYPTSSLAADARLRIGICRTRLKQFDLAAKELTTLATESPALADQALLWLAKAQFGLAESVDPKNTADHDAKLKAAMTTLEQASAKAKALAQKNDEDAKARYHDIRFELAEAKLRGQAPKDAAREFEQLWNEQAWPKHRDQLLQRLCASASAAGELDRAEQRCAEFRTNFPQSPLMPTVMFLQAENAYARAVEFEKNRNSNRDEYERRYSDAIGKYKEVIEVYPDFDRVNLARYGAGVCLARLGKLDDATKILRDIPADQRIGDLAPTASLLADCLMRQVPLRMADEQARRRAGEMLTTAAEQLDQYLTANATAPDAPAVMLKLGHCRKRLGEFQTDAAARTSSLTKARDTFEKFTQTYPTHHLVGEAVVERAKVRALLGDRGGAMNDLRQFQSNAELQKSPVAPLAALHLATLYREERNPTEATKILEAARQKYEASLAADPERSDWRFLLRYHHAVALEEMSQLAEARKLFEEIISQAKDKTIAAEASLRSGHCHIREGEELFKQGLELRNQAGNDAGKRNQAEQKIQQARQTLSAACQQLEQRGEQFRNVLPDAEVRSRLYYNAAWGWRKLAVDAVERATRQLQEQAAQRLPPGSPLPEIPLQKVPVQNEEERTFIAYRRLIEEFPDALLSVEARLEYAELKANRGDPNEAVKYLSDALTIKPDDQPVPVPTLEKIHLRLGASLAAKGDHAAAEKEFAAVADHAGSPYQAQAVYHLGECRFAQGHYEQAAKTLTIFRDKAEFHSLAGVSDRAMLRLAQSLAQTKQWDAGRQAGETLIQRFGPTNPLAAEARYVIGWSLQNQNNFDGAVTAYEQVTAATTTEIAAQAQIRIGQCRMAQKQFDAAAAAFLIVPYTYGYPELGFAALLEAGRALEAGGKVREAERILRRLVADAPRESEWSQAATERLNLIRKMD